MAVSILIIWADFAAGPIIRLPILFVFPVIAVSWYWGLIIGETLAIGLPVLRLALAWHINKPWALEDSIINTAILVLALAMISFLVYIINQQSIRIKVLQGILPICSFCKKIRTPEDQWEQMESYISHHSQAEFSHGVCPECADRHYGTLFDKK